jgi:hypothetical protein
MFYLSARNRLDLGTPGIEASKEANIKQRMEAEPSPEPQEEKAITQAITTFGEARTPPQPVSNVHVMSIIGQIEGHIIPPPPVGYQRIVFLVPGLLAQSQ